MNGTATPEHGEFANRKYRDEPHPEDPRTPFQHDKDRILYSTAFRRLQYKTQVYVIHEGDLYRTRLTHTLEVAQIARALASFLEADIDLAEAIALAHDIGHAPFGHAGGEKLRELGATYGLSFEHNIQSYKIVSSLEERYASFKGLNLTHATLEGILRHCTYFDNEEEIKSSIPPELNEVLVYWRSQQPGAEAQIVNLADIIAYAAHDIEDALSAGLINLDTFKTKVKEEKITFLEKIIEEELPKHIRSYQARLGDATGMTISKVQNRIMARLIIDKLIRETVQESEANIKNLSSRGGELWMRIREHKSLVVALPNKLEEQVKMLVTSVLFKCVYQEPRVVIMMEKAKRILETLFHAFMREPRALPTITQAQVQDYFRMPAEQQRGEAMKKMLAGVIIDYISGMTDKYAMDTYELLTQAYEKVL